MAKKLIKNITFTCLIAIILLFSSCLLIGCGKKKVAIEDIKINLESTECFLGQSKMLYFTKTPLNANDYQLIWSSSNKEIVSVNWEGEITGNNYGEAEITLQVKGTDISSKCKVTVNDGAMAGLRINTGTAKHTYYEGERIDPTGLIITGVYESLKEVQIDYNDCLIQHPEFAEEGATIKVTYGGITREYELLIKKDIPLGLEITTKPTKTEYFIGETFDPTGMEVVMKYSSGKKELITGYTFDNSPIDVNQLQVKISYEKFSELVSIKSVARRIVTEPEELQSAINEGVSSIMITNGILRTLNSPIILENAKDITIFSQRDNTTLRGWEIVPIKIIGTIENVRFIGFTIEAGGTQPAENIFDLSDCTGGILTLKNMRFTTSQPNTALLPNELDVTIAYNNCRFNYESQI